MADAAPPVSRNKPTKVRYFVVAVATLMAMLLYLDRFCVGFAADYIREDLNLKQSDIAFFISAFFISYALAQVPSGYLSDRYGARIMLAIYVLTWSVFTALIGWAYSFFMLVSARLMLGVGQAGAYPTSASVVSKWVPFAARGTASSIVAFGGRMGGTLAPLLTAWLIVQFVPADTPLTFTPEKVLHGPRLTAKLAPGESEDSDILTPKPEGDHVWSLLSTDEQSLVAKWAAAYRERKDGIKPDAMPAEDRAALAAMLSRLVTSDSVIFSEVAFQAVKLPRETLGLLAKHDAGTMTSAERQRLNRFLLEGVFPEEVGKLYTPGWRPVLILYGALGIVVAGLIWFFFRSRPEVHPWCNAAEVNLIESGRPAGAPGPHGKPGVVPLKRLMMSRSMWLVCFSQFGTNVGWLFTFTWLPRYLIDVYNTPILERGVMSSVPPLVGIAGMLCGGWLTDTMARRFGVKWGRRFPMMATRFLAASGYALVLFFTTSGDGLGLNTAWMCVAALSLVTFATDCGTPSTWAFKQDVGGRYVGSVLGWGNMWGNIGAAIAPLIYTAFLGEHPSGDDWNAMFYVCMGAFVFAGFCALGVDATIPIAPPDED